MVAVFFFIPSLFDCLRLWKSDIITDLSDLKNYTLCYMAQEAHISSQNKAHLTRVFVCLF